MIETLTMVMFEFPVSRVPVTAMVDPTEDEPRIFRVRLTLTPEEVNELSDLITTVKHHLDSHFTSRSQSGSPDSQPSPGS